MLFPRAMALAKAFSMRSRRSTNFFSDPRLGLGGDRKRSVRENIGRFYTKIVSLGQRF
jgi:hypothetical protein